MYIYIYIYISIYLYKINVESQIFSGTIARMINGFLSQTNDLDTFSTLLKQKKRIKPQTPERNDEVNDEINDEENVADQFMFWY